MTPLPEPPTFVTSPRSEFARHVGYARFDFKRACREAAKLPTDDSDLHTLIGQMVAGRLLIACIPLFERIMDIEDRVEALASALTYDVLDHYGRRAG